MPNLRALYSSASPEWYTPPDLLAEIRAFFGGDYFDPCPASDGDVQSDGLMAMWGKDAQTPVYCNPPYGRVIGQWIRKALSEQVSELILLVPARTDTGWFAPLFAYPICYMRGRLRFSGATSGAPFPSALVYLGPRVQEFAAAFAHRGTVCVPLQQMERSALSA